MSTHSSARIWIHMIWETLCREPMLDKDAAAKASIHLSEYSLQKGIYMKINYFNADHTHTLFDLPTGKCGATRETVKTVEKSTCFIYTRLKPGVNERG
jgi:hypothetical protein